MTMKCTFQVGDRVVCVDAEATASKTGERELFEGTVYTVRSVYIDNAPSDGPYAGHSTCIRVSEINPRLDYNGEPTDRGFAAARFRPVKPLSFWLGEKQEITREIERAA